MFSHFIYFTFYKIINILSKKYTSDVGFSIRAIKCNNVDFPEPDGPVKAIRSTFLLKNLNFSKLLSFYFDE